MNTFKKILASMFATLFIVTAILALILFNFDRRAFSAETYKKTFADSNFYNELPVLMSEAMTSPSSRERLPLVMQGMSAQAWEAFFRAILPQDVLQAMGDEVLDSVFAYLNIETNSAELSLLPLKTGMLGDAGAQAALTLLKTQPDCTALQIGQMTVDLLSNSQIQFCNPPEKLIPVLTPVIQAQLQSAALVLPDQYTLISAPPANDPRQRLQSARMVMRLSPILPLGFLLLTTLFGVNTFKNWLRWWGTPFTITGAAACLMGWSGAPLVSGLLQRLLVNRMSTTLPPAMLDYSGKLASAMLNTLLNPIFWQGFALAVTGLVMVVTSYLVKRQKTGA